MKILADTQLSDYYLYFVRDFGSNAYHVAPRIFDLAPDKWETLAAIYYSRHGFKAPPKEDAYIGTLPNGVEAWRSHLVDALVLENPTTLDDAARFLLESWQMKKAALAKRRSEDPAVVILPPPQEPPMYEPEPKVKPIELPPLPPVAKKQRPEWMIKASVWMTVLTPIVLAVSYFVPPPFNLIAKAVFEAIKLLVGG